MLPRYAHIGKSITIVGGRISILGSAVFAFAMLAGSAVMWVVNMETDWLSQSHPIWQVVAVVVFALVIKAWVGHWLFKPLPVFRLPTTWKNLPELGLWQASMARLPFLEWGGFEVGSLWHFGSRKKLRNHYESF